MTVVYVGHDEREQQAYDVCKRSLRAHSPSVRVRPISYPLIGDLYSRPVERRGAVLYDVISDAPMSTEFSLARFFAPVLHQRIGGPEEPWLVFCDGDFLWRAPVERLMAHADPRYAVMVVKHTQRPVETRKMDGQPQTAYERKNWSSLMLMNVPLITHPSFGARLYQEMLNVATGLDLQQFRWCPDALIGELPAEWNHLVGVSPHADNPQAVHFTLGTPDLPGYEDYPFANEWRRYL